MLFRVKALYEYSSPHEDDLGFPQGQVISVTEEEDDDWYVGEYTDAMGIKKAGLFPKNFVEKIEPEMPPRPARPARHKQPEAPPPAEEPPADEPSVEAATSPVMQSADQEKALPAPAEASQPESKEIASPPPPQAPVASKPAPPPTSPQPAAKPSAPPPGPAAKVPPAVAEKPSSFKDRIAAFNKPAAAPIAPFKPGGAPSTFIKKPFVAPPPSRNAYVPPPREAPQARTYRRDEDPEIAERRAQDQENAERAGFNASANQEEGEDAPKPTSLKERIALLQKQQMEQARRAEVSHKEKPKRPPKKRTESHEKQESHADDETANADTTGSISSDIPRESVRPPAPRKPSHGPPATEVLSDANDADQSAAGETTEDAEGTSTSVEEDDERKAAPAHAQPPKPAVTEQAEEEEGESTEDEEDEMDEETRRRMELRERMAKMSGGMGMAGMFGPPGGLPMGIPPPKKKKAPPPPERKSTDDSVTSHQPARIAMIPVPGMARVRSPEVEDKQFAVDDVTEEPASIDDSPDIENIKPRSSSMASHDKSAQSPVDDREQPSNFQARGAPPVPGGRPVPPPPPVALQSPSAGSESDDEMTENTSEVPAREAPPPIPSSNTRPDQITPMQSPPAVKRTSYMGSTPTSPEIPSEPSGHDKRHVRVPTIPVGGSAVSPLLQSRPPPPPPPTAAPPSRQSTFDGASKRMIGGDEEEGETEYEGDYDTDIAPGATHKDALKSHAREASLDESTTADDTPIRSPGLPPAGPPPIPTSSAPRAVPPPPPAQPPSHRQSVDAPRGAPPPVPPPREAAVDEDDEYDPFRYSSGGPPRAVPPVPKAPAPPSLPPGAPPSAPPPPRAPITEDEEQSDEDDLYSSPPPRRSTDRIPPPPPQAPPAHPRHAVPPLPPHPPQDRDLPAPPPPQAPHGHAPPPPPPSAPALSPLPRKSGDASRMSMTAARRSMDQARPSTDTGYIANDVDLGYGSQWWAQSKIPPPIFQGRRDVYFEIDEPVGSKRSGGKVAKNVFVIFQDYSQTIVTASYDPQNPSDVVLEQRHESPPQRLRQDQLEAAHARFGARIADSAAAKQNTVVGDGAPQSLIHELLRPHGTALSPVGTRAYGALVYANLANATVQQYDEIRPGDIISFRNAKFQGKHGAMHAKYSTDVGKPDHVGIVVDWDGTKKKVRAFEQGRESKKVKLESFRVGDLRSGEVRVWRVMDRAWVGWENQSS